MHWPFRRADRGTLAFAGGGPRLPWAHRDAASGALRFGVAERGPGADGDAARRWRASGLGRRGVRAVLPLAQSHWLQLSAPPVPPAEWREAVRWQLADRVDTPPAELAVDVIPVGAEGAAAPAGARQLFVAATPRPQLQRLQADAQALGWELTSVEVAETAQRNLQCAADAAIGQAGRASAALVRHGRFALLTFCADGELYQTRRLDLEALAPVQQPDPMPLLDNADIVDYGALDDGGDGLGLAADPAADPLRQELQRSIDVWERTWPGKPLASLWLAVGDDLAARLAPGLGAPERPVRELDALALLAGDAVADARAAFASVRDEPGLEAAWLPVLGALLRPAGT